MARPKNSVPTYRLHSPSGTARCWVAGRWVALGRYNSPESRAEYARILAELAVSPAPEKVAAPGTPDLTVNELLVAFWGHAEHHYRHPDGTPTNELPQFRQTFRLLRELYGRTPAAEFGPLALKTLRSKMVEVGWTRRLINQPVRLPARSPRHAPIHLRAVPTAGRVPPAAVPPGWRPAVRRHPVRRSGPPGADRGWCRLVRPHLHPAVTLWLLLGQVLSPDQSCRAAVARLNAHRVARGERPCSARTGAYCQARQRLPEQLVADVARRTGRALDASSDTK